MQRIAAEEKSSGGIYLPESAQEKPAQGKVLSLGSGILTRDGTRVEFQVQEGDRVLFSAHAGTQFNLDGQELLILREADILAVLG